MTAPLRKVTESMRGLTKVTGALSRSMRGIGVGALKAVGALTALGGVNLAGLGLSVLKTARQFESTKPC